LTPLRAEKGYEEAGGDPHRAWLLSVRTCVRDPKGFFMKITRREVEHVADLARLELSEQEQETLTHQLSNILTYVEKLNELDTKGVEPTSHVLDIRNVMRDDVARPSLPQERALANAPEKAAGHYKVPKIIE
jgi:aspartyl-tRNA(Asn)/glutamyl-tRNA(Gln) amidotransferase subunit C